MKDTTPCAIGRTRTKRITAPYHTLDWVIPCPRAAEVVLSPRSLRIPVCKTHAESIIAHFARWLEEREQGR